MRGFKRRAFAGVLALFPAAGAPASEARNPYDETTIRAGRKIADTICIACHAVSRAQAQRPVLGARIPSFEEIANMPDSTVDSLREAMRAAKWRGHAIAVMVLPMSRISDGERTQVAAYIISLRRHR